ncbi:MAG: hypothetical protein QHJ73_02525 [Armatimonadota bacterium]|nr:hypothetical protein [Armatimonadota bacterium]
MGVLALLVSPWTCAAPGAGSTSPPDKPPVVVLVVVQAVSLRELWETPTTGIRNLLISGAVGVMNTRTGPNTGGRLGRAIDSLVLHPEEMRPSTLESACLTLGAGTRCFARSEAGEAFAADESILAGTGAQVWAQRMGMPPGRYRTFHAAIPQLAARQKSLRYPAAPGALGEALREAGVPVAVVGNADDDTGPHREAVCIGMDTLGRVPLGSVGPHLSQEDAWVPGGCRTNATALLHAVEEALENGARFVVVETGDTARVDRATEEVLTEVRPRRRSEAIQRVDAVVAGLLRMLDPASTLLILAAPAPSLDASRSGNPLAPVVLAGLGVERGLVYSPSTRTPGLAVNTDIAPTVLAFLGCPIPTQMVGRPLTSRRASRGTDQVLALEARFRRVEDYARPLARWLVWAQTLLFGVFLLLAWVRPHPHLAPLRFLRAVGVMIAAMPAAVLLVGRLVPLPPVPPNPESSTGALVGGALFAALLALLGMAAVVVRQRVSPVGVLWAAGAVLFLFDVVTGNRLLQTSPFCYSPYAGARYYGIGNEGFGLLIPALLLAPVCLAPARWGLPVGGALLFAGAALVGHPLLGANFGGAVTTAATAAAASLLAWRSRVRRRTLLLVLAALAAVAFFTVGWEVLQRPEAQSHIGRALAAVGSGGPAEAFDIVARKLGMNLRLLRYSPWSRLFVLALAALACVAWPWRRQTAEAFPGVRAAALALLAGSAVAMLTNDSGVQPAAEMTAAATAAMGWHRVARSED